MRGRASKKAAITTLAIGKKGGSRIGTFVAAASNNNGATLSFPGTPTFNVNGYYGANLQVAEVPEPETYALLVSGLALVGLRRRGTQAS